jgi:uncharacterized membrane protein YfcA
VTVLTLSLLLALGSFVAGLLGALTGLGGGVVLVPLLVLVFGVDLPFAAAVSLVATIGTSTASAASFTRAGLINLRLAMLLEVATSVGGVAGAFLVAFALVPSHALAVLFGVVLLVSAYATVQTRPAEPADAPPDPLATWLRLDPPGYHLRRVPLGFGLMLVAGVLSGLLGIGSGAMKVLAMDLALGVPYKAATATSNLMIGVTAAASAGVYMGSGHLDPALAFPAVVGVVVGSALGARLMPVLGVGLLRWLFAGVVVLLGVQMILRGLAR